jgi:hypothetical protein
MPGVSTGPNSRPLGDGIAETGPGIPDEAVLRSHLHPEDFSGAEADRQAEALRQRGWIGGRDGAEDEAEAHPS